MEHEKLWTKEFILVNLIQFSVNMGYFMLYSTIGIYTRGLTSVEFYVGLVTGIFTFASLVTRVFSGDLLNKFAPKSVLLFGLTLSLAACVGYLFADTMPLLLLMRILNGLGYGLSSAAAATMVSSMLPPHRLMEGLGYSMMFFTLCSAVGPSLGLNLSHSMFNQFYKVFWVTVLFAILSIGLVCSVPQKKTSLSVAERGPVSLERTMRQQKATLATVIFLILTFLLAFSQSSVVACLNLYALDRNFGNLSLFFILFASVNFLARLFMKQILQMLSERVVFIIITAVLIFVYVGIYMANGALSIFLLAVPFGFSMGFYYPLLTTKTIKTMSQFQQGASNSLYLASEDMGFFLGAIFWGGIADFIGGYQRVYLIAGAMAVLMLCIVVWYPRILQKYGVKEEVW